MNPLATAPDNQDQTHSTADATLPLTQDEWLGLAREAHTASTSYFDTAIRKSMIENLRLFQSQHPSGSKYLADAYRARSKFFRPKTRAAVRKNEAIAAQALFSTTDVIDLKAMDDDDPTSRASAEIMKALVQYRLTTPDKGPPWFLIAMGAYQDAQVQGIVCSYNYWEYNLKKGIDRPCIKLLPLENVRFDAAAEWYDPVNTSPYWIEMVPMYVKDVLARMKTIDAKTGQPKWIPADQATILKALTNYADIVRLQREQGRVDPRTMTSAIGKFSVVWVHRNIIEVDGLDYIYHTLGTSMMLDKPKPLDKVYFHGKRPYTAGFAVIETHRPYPSAPVALTAQTQGELNENANQRSDNVKFAMNKRYLVRRTAQVDTRSLQRNVPSSTTQVGDVEKDVKIIDTPDVTRSAYEEQDRLNLDFDDLAGSFSQASVQANRRLNETVGGMNILTKDASQIGGYQLKTFLETWAEPTLRQLVMLEQRYETDNAVLSLAGNRANLFQRFGIDQITDDLLMAESTLTVNVGMTATNPQDQLTNFIQGLVSLKEVLADHVLENLGADVGEIIKEVMGRLGHKDGKRFFPGTQDPRITSLQAQVQQLMQEIANKGKDPTLIAAQVQKLKAEAVKVGVESEYSAVQTGEVIAAIPAVAPVADVVMKAAGYIAPVPAGVDPGLDQAPVGDASGLATEAVKNRRTGVDFMPGGGPVQAQGVAGGPTASPPLPSGNTHPNLPAPVPKPASPGAGAAKGIETQRPDGVK